MAEIKSCTTTPTVIEEGNGNVTITTTGEIGIGSLGGEEVLLTLYVNGAIINTKRVVMLQGGNSFEISGLLQDPANNESALNFATGDTSVVEVAVSDVPEPDRTTCGTIDVVREGSGGIGDFDPNSVTVSGCSNQGTTVNGVDAAVLTAFVENENGQEAIVDVRWETAGGSEIVTLAEVNVPALGARDLEQLLSMEFLRDQIGPGEFEVFARFSDVAASG